MNLQRKKALALCLLLGFVLVPGLVSAATITVNTTGAVREFNVGSIIVTGAASGLAEGTNTSTNFGVAGITTAILTVTNSALIVDVVGHGRIGSYTPGFGQTEHWDIAALSATGAMSSKTDVVAGGDSMTQTHSSGIPNRNAHAVIAVTPDVAGVPVTVVSQRRSFQLNAAQAFWTHPNEASAETAKLFVGVAMEDNNCAADATVTSVTFGNLNLTRLVAVQTGGGFCQRVEIWYVDLPHLILSTRNNAVIGGTAIDQDEAVEYDAADDIGSLFLDESVFAANEQLNAIHVLANGNVAIATRGPSVVDGNAIDPADIVEITTGGTFVQTLFNGDTLFSNPNERIDAVWIRDNGNIGLSTASNANLVGTPIRREDIVEFDPSGPAVLMQLLFDGSLEIVGGSNVDGVHVLDDDNLLFSTTGDETSAGGVSFLDGDVMLFERNPVPATAGTVSVHMSESHYSANEDTNAISFVVPAVAGLDHFDISFAAAGSTCVASEIVIEAKDAGGTTITTYTGTVTLSTSTGNGTWTAPGTTSDPALGTFTPGAPDSGAATYTFVAGDSGDIAIELANEHAETLTITVDDAAAVVTTVSGNLTFSDNAFVITPTTSGGDNVVAGRDHVFHIQMVRRDGVDCGVATGYNNVAQTLKAWIVRDADDPGGVLPALAEQTAALGDGAPPGADNLLLDFSVLPGESDFTLETTDVGKYVVNIRDDTNGFADVDIDGVTNTLTVRPFGFDVQVTGNPAATGPGGSGFVSAGTDFTVTVRAVAWESADDDGVPIGTADDGIPDGHESGDSDPSNNVDLSNNAATPAYGQEPVIEVVSLSGLLDQPAVFDPGLSGGTSIAGFVAGVGSSTTVRYDEVGIIEIRALLPGDGIYLGGQAIEGVSGFVGRFFPDRFDLAASTITNRSDLACASSFTYMDETLNINYTLNAENATGAVTQNYDGAFAKLLLDTPSMNFGAVDTAAPTDLTARLTVNSTTSAGWSAGVAVIDSELLLDRVLPIDGPFDLFNVGIAPVDTPLDDNVQMETLDIDVDNNAVDDHATLGATIQRFGRLFLDGAFGSEIATLPVPMQIEFFDGVSFVINDGSLPNPGSDDCTPLAPTDLILDSDFDTPQTDGDVFIISGGGCPAPGCTTATIANNPAFGGDSGLSFSSPGAGNVGHADVTTDLTLLGLPYLLYDWDSDGSFDNDPLVEITFGIFQGSSVIIYRREPGF